MLICKSSELALPDILHSAFGFHWFDVMHTFIETYYGYVVRYVIFRIEVLLIFTSIWPSFDELSSLGPSLSGLSGVEVHLQLKEIMTAQKRLLK